MAMTIHVDIVSVEAQIFSGEAEYVIATGKLGELGIWPRHTPLITALKPGQIRVKIPSESEEIFYVSGGLLEVQPHVITILADTIVRAADLDEAAAVEAKERAEQALQNRQDDIDYARAYAESMAQLEAIRRLQKSLRMKD